MTLEATYRQEGEIIDYTAVAALTGGQVIQLKDGRAAVVLTDIAAGAKGAVQVCGVYRMQKAASVVMLQGGRVYWDHSANVATFRKVNDRDFYAGRVAADAAAADTTVDVILNHDPRYDVSLAGDPYLSTNVGTAAAGGFGYPVRLGGAIILELTATSEAQKCDALSVDGFAKGANAIIEGAFRVLNKGAGAAPDVSLGVANGTHASDADSIAESIFIHLDGNNLAINAESDDGTNEIVATATTVSFVEGSDVAKRVEFWIDMRDPASVKFYIDGVAVLTATTFNVDASAGPWFLLAHLEKTTGTDVYKIAVDWLRARFAED